MKAFWFYAKRYQHYRLLCCKKNKIEQFKAKELERRDKYPDDIGYIKSVMTVEMLEETEIMPEYNDVVETKLYIALLSQFSYVCFFPMYFEAIGSWAFALNLMVMYLMIGSYGYYFKKSGSRRMTGIKIWTDMFSLVAMIGILYTLYIMFK